MTKWARDYWTALHPHNLPGAYVNFMMADEGDDRIKATYRDNYKKLVAVKKKYDKDESVPGESEHQAVTDAVALRRVDAHRHRDLGDRATDDAEGVTAPSAVALSPLHRLVSRSHQRRDGRAADERGDRAQSRGVRLRRQHLLHRLRAVRGAEQPHPRAGRRAAMDRAHRDHVGARLLRDDVRAAASGASTRCASCSGSRKPATSRASSST